MGSERQAAHTQQKLTQVTHPPPTPGYPAFEYNRGQSFTAML